MGKTVKKFQEYTKDGVTTFIICNGIFSFAHHSVKIGNEPDQWAFIGPCSGACRSGVEEVELASLPHVDELWRKLQSLGQIHFMVNVVGIGDRPEIHYKVIVSKWQLQAVLTSSVAENGGAIRAAIIGKGMVFVDFQVKVFLDQDPVEVHLFGDNLDQGSFQAHPDYPDGVVIFQQTAKSWRVVSGPAQKVQE